MELNGEQMDRTQFQQRLRERISAADLRQVKADVLPFVRNPKELDIWSNDYFLKHSELILWA